MSISDLAGLIAAIAFAVLVIAVTVPMIKLGGVLKEVRKTVSEMTEHTTPILDEAATTVSQANAQMERIDTVTKAAAEMSQNASALTALTASTLGKPLIKLSAFSYGVRQALQLRRDGKRS